MTNTPAPGAFCSDDCACDSPCFSALMARAASNQQRDVDAKLLGEQSEYDRRTEREAAHTSIYRMLDALEDSAVAREVGFTAATIDVDPGHVVLRQFATGAVRDADADARRYDLISPHGLDRLAATYAEGAAKYDDHNWRKGMPFSSTLNHAMRHLTLWNSGDTSEDHLAHAAWGLFALMEFEATRPELDDRFAFPCAVGA